MKVRGDGNVLEILAIELPSEQERAKEKKKKKRGNEGEREIEEERDWNFLLREIKLRKKKILRELRFQEI